MKTYNIQKDLIFEGIKIEGNAVARLQVTEKKDKKDDNEKPVGVIGGEVKFEVTLLAHTFSTDKIYLT